VSVQFSPVADLGHGRGPILLHELDAALDARLLLRPTHQTEQRLEQVVTGQGLVAVVESAIATGQQVRRHGLGVVPPEFVRHTTEEGEGFDQAVEDGLGALGRQSQGERAIGISPGHEQDRDELTALGKIDVDVAEVGFEALAGIVVEGDKGLGRSRLPGANVEANALGTARVVVLVAETTEDLGGGMALLPWRGLIGAKDVVDEGLEGIENRRRPLPARIRFRFGLAEDLADLAAGVMELACQFPDAEFFDGMGSADTCVLVHVDHPSPPCSWTPKRCTSLQEACWGWARFRRGFWPGGGPVLDEGFQRGIR
jgi:hypothetical protein